MAQTRLMKIPQIRFTRIGAEDFSEISETPFGIIKQLEKEK
jgi:hypothetical protein